MPFLNSKFGELFLDLGRQVESVILPDIPHFPTEESVPITESKKVSRAEKKASEKKVKAAKSQIEISKKDIEALKKVDSAIDRLISKSEDQFCCRLAAQN